jgi:protein involved in polysaccharide export with SLBB domain
MKLTALHLGSLTAALLLTAGCASVVQKGVPLSQVPPASFFETPYVLQPLDKIEVQFLIQQNYNTVVQIRPDGMISMPEIPAIRAAGSTPEQLADSIKKVYANKMINPVITVLIRDYANLRTFVGGEVATPGVQQMLGHTTVLQAIMAAGGFKPTARTDEVVVIRKTAPEHAIVFAVNLDSAVSGKNVANDVELEPQDVVVVPRSNIADFDLWIDQYIRLALPLQTSANAGVSYNLGHTKP